MNPNTKKQKEKRKKLFILLLLISISIVFILSKVGIMNYSYFSSKTPTNSSMTTPKPTKVNVKNDGTILVNERPFFPFGFYHVSWESTAQERKSALHDIAVAGFNTIHASATNLDDYGEFLDEAERLGVYVVTEQNVGLLDLINAFKHKPAVLGWSIADDVDNGRLVPQEVLKFHQEAKLADPHHITYISGYSEKIGEFGNYADVVAMQSYPIGNGDDEINVDDEISLTYDRISLARDALIPNKKAVYANLQTFDWAVQGPENQKYKQRMRAPTFEEVRNMTYQSILAGAKGIIYYTYHDQVWHLPSAKPELWKKMKSLVPEIKAISSFLLEGELKIIDVGVEKVIAGIWTYQNQSLIVAVNRSHERQGVSIAIPGNFSQIKPIFDNRPANLVLNGNRLSGFLTPLDVEVYQATTEF
jgi:hypothetical protein